jgi:hypothetical protein
VPLYATDGTSTRQTVTTLPRNTYLRVISAGTARLEVQAYDESGKPSDNGWVDPNQVLPSAPGTDWLVVSTPTTLWTSPDGSAVADRDLTPFAPLQQLGDPVLGRAHVNVYASDFSRVVASGWVDVTATGPALPPPMRVASQQTWQRSASAPSQQAFLDGTGGLAREAALRTGVPASVTVAQAILESDWGRSTLATAANNYFGMKAMGSLGTDGVVYLPTSEYDDSGNVYTTTSAFRAYHSMSESIVDHDLLLETSNRYADAMQFARDPRQFAAAIAQDGYSTDPAYADKLVALMDRYNLYALDA